MRVDRIVRFAAATQTKRAGRGLRDAGRALQALGAATVQVLLAATLFVLSPLFAPPVFAVAHRRNWHQRGKILRSCRRAAGEKPPGWHPFGRNKQLWAWAFPQSRLYPLIDRMLAHSATMMRIRLRPTPGKEPAPNREPAVLKAEIRPTTNPDDRETTR